MGKKGCRVASSCRDPEYSLTLDQNQSSGFATKPRRTGFRWMYSTALLYSLTVLSARSKKRPCQRRPASLRLLLIWRVAQISRSVRSLRSRGARGSCLGSFHPIHRVPLAAAPLITPQCLFHPSSFPIHHSFPPPFLPRSASLIAETETASSPARMWLFVARLLIWGRLRHDKLDTGKFWGRRMFHAVP